MLARPGFQVLAPRLRPAPQRIRKAIFPVGGLGTRFLPATKAIPKEMLPVVDKPLIQYAVEEAKAAGVEEFIFVTSRGKNAIEDHLDQSQELHAHLEARGKINEAAALHSWLPEPGQATFIRQPEPRGLGHAVWCARSLIGNEPFAVLLPDDLILAVTPCLRQMVRVHAEVGGNLVAVMPVPRAQVSRYGVIDPVMHQDRLVEASGMVEKPAPELAPSNLAVIGRYILQPDIFQHLEAVEPGAGGEIQLTDAIAHMISDHALHGFQFDGRRFDCGDKLGFLEANLAFALGRTDLGPGTAAMIERYAHPHADTEEGADIPPPSKPNRVRARA
ncbi:MAG: UTP--glucose-1-phosphate uridylyltransferase GalU [Alphaproteobacteria bacterium]|nr:UTP--glucose-1-phosphate uridylyltransferase GalU [Alphaproteobacteria bacterium]